MSRYTFYGLVLHVSLAGMLLANDGMGQESIDDIKVELKAQTTSVRKLFSEIEKNTNFHFVYIADNSIYNSAISISKREDTVGKLLRKVAHTMPLDFKRINNTINVSLRQSNAMSDNAIEEEVKQVRISGKVTAAEDGEPLPGVSILVKGTSTGSTTDVDGNYTLSAPEGSVLQFSYIGFLTQEITIGNQTTLNVSLEADLAQLEEVVVIGYGTQRKKDVTGSIASVSGEDIKKVPVVGLDQALQGKAAGVQVFNSTGQPGGGVNVRIRGTGTIGNNQPLYVVDGYPLTNNFDQGFLGGAQASNPLNAINPADIESIEVLKDASATAIYGSRGANGVVIITTKRGKSGTSSITYDASYGRQSVVNKVEVITGDDYWEFIQDLGNDANPAFPYYNEARAAGTDTDWVDEILRVAPQQSHNLTAQGGNENVRYSLSAGYFDQEGIVIGTGLERYSFRSNIDVNVNEKLKVGFNLAPTYVKNEAIANGIHFVSGNVINTALAISPMVPVRDDDGNLSNLAREIGRQAGGNRRFDGLAFPNPLIMSENNVNDLDQTRLIGSTYLEWEALEGLTFKTNLGGDVNYYKGRTFISGAAQFGNISNQGNLIYESFLENTNWITENTVNFKRVINQDHQIDVLAGFTYQENRASSLNGAKDNLASEDIKYLSNFTVEGVRTGSNVQEWSLVSFLSRVNYSFKDKYLLTASIRRDGSSRFGANTRYGNFPSVAVGWRLSEEAFIQDLDLFSNLKVRASIGETGNFEIGNYEAIPALGNTVYPLGGMLMDGFHPSNFAFSNLTWETTIQRNIGLDLGLLDGALNFSANYYVKETEDMLLSAPLPAVTGFSQGRINIGSMENKGWEFELGYNKMIGDLYLSTNFNIAFNENLVTGLNGDENFFIRSGSRGTSRTEVGLPVGQFWAYVSDGIFMNQAEIDEANARAREITGDPNATFQGPNVVPGDRRFKDVNGDGIITTDGNDQDFVGDPNPDFIWGWSTSLEWKNFDFTFAFNGVQGNGIWDTNYAGNNANGRINQLANMKNRWRSESDPGDGNTHRAFVGARTNIVNNHIESSWHVFDGSFIRLRNITLGYTLPSSVLEKVKISNLRLYVSGANLLTFTDFEGWDPEAVTSGNGNPLNQGEGWGVYPNSKVITTGISLTF